jgi:hypothetical protein
MGKESAYMQIERQRARAQLVTALLEGCTFQEVSRDSPVLVKRAMAYRLLRAVRTRGKEALQDGRHGHPSKLLLQASACFSRVMEPFLCSGELNTPAFFSIEFE